MPKVDLKAALPALGGGVVLCALLALAGAAYAQTDIVSASANSNLTSITITGRALQPASAVARNPTAIRDVTAREGLGSSDHRDGGRPREQNPETSLSDHQKVGRTAARAIACFN